MIKNNLKKLIITSVVILLPIIAGLILWNKLPDSIPIHWSFAGEADNYAGKGFVVFAIPLLMLFCHIVCIVATALDPKNKNQSKKPMDLIMWSMPAVSLLLAFVVYAQALGYSARVESIAFVFVGVLIIVIGNYLPKCKQNYTLGIKVVWALENEENWNATHRFGGRLWMVGGVLLIACAFLPAPWNAVLFVPLLIAMTLAPMVYSYVYYKKHPSDSKEEK
ncbi:MAG: DUF1648 domain-containing protein [Ruminococcaceae bacterium]|nr:DUF1648 domain-containing protein [Oscillospiraceae bacterium]